MARSQRNEKVESAVSCALEQIDLFVAGERVQLPSSESRHSCDLQLDHRSASVRVASLFFAFYSLADHDWDCDELPIGYRGEYGDKRLANELTQRSITLHNAITAFGENLGWKGNKVNVRLSNDPRFADFCAALSTANEEQRELISNYLASRFAESRREKQGPVRNLVSDSRER